MTLSVRVRFEVFKRDRFTCGYCGGHPPDILLEVDHIVPRAAGGSDDLVNLVTACVDCNRGKTDRLLEEGQRPAINPRAIEELGERVSQAQAYAELLDQMGDVTESTLDRLMSSWAAAFEARTEERSTGSVWVLQAGNWPTRASLRKFLQDLTPQEITDAMEAAASRVGDRRGNDRYFYAVCWRLVRDRRGSGLPVSDEVLDLRAENDRLRDELTDAQDTIHDLRINVQRLREEAGRE